MRQQFKDFDFTPNTERRIAQINEVIAEYAQQGFSLTVRQLYYQFVARGLIQNNDREYINLGKAVANGRLAGLIDWDAIVDRTRQVRGNPHWDSPYDIVDQCARQYRRWLWEDQEHYVEVWIEKDALVGVIEDICCQWDVKYFSSRGYASQSAMYRAAQRMVEMDRPCVVLHFSDHDPSGVDMSRDIGDRLDLLSEGADITVDRIALTMDQIEEFDPPPFYVKVSDSRSPRYVRRYGNSSWELDALRPDVLTGLVNEEIENLVDMAKFEAAVKRQEKERKVLAKTAKGLKPKRRRRR